MRICFCRDLLKKDSQEFTDLQVVEAAELFLYCFLDLEAHLDAHLDAHQSVSKLTSGDYGLEDAMH